MEELSKMIKNDLEIVEEDILGHLLDNQVTDGRIAI